MLDYVFSLDSGRAVELRMSGMKNGVIVEAGEKVSPAERKAIRNAVVWMLGLDQNFTEFYSLARRESKLASVVKKSQGRVLRSATLFEDVVKTILTTNTLWAATKRMSSALVLHYGKPVVEDSPRRAFPTPEALAGLTEKKLRDKARLGYRSPYILRLAQTISSNEFDLESLKTSDLSTPELRKKLQSMKGVGPYAAANLLMLLGRYDFVPIDSWALKVVSHEWHRGRAIGPEEVESAFERWGKWKGLVYWFWDWSLLQKQRDNK